MISGAHNGTTFIAQQYKEEEAPEIIKTFFDSIKKSS